MKDKNQKPETEWEKGFKAGAEVERRQNDKEVRLGRAIMDILYEVFELKKEDY